MVDSTAAGTAARGLLPPGLQRAPCVGPTDLAKQEGPLPAAIRGERGDVARSRSRSQAPRSRGRLLERSPYLGTDLAAASTCSLRGAGRRIVPGRPTLDPIATAFLPAGEGLEPRLSWQVCGWPEGRLSPEEAPILCRMPSAGGRGRLREISADVVSRRLGGVCEAPLRWSRTRSALFGPIHASRRNLQPPAR